MKFKTLILIFIVVLSGFAGIANSKEPKNFLISNVTLFDGEEIINNTSVLVENGKVTKIQKNIESDYESIDGSGKFLMPGMTNSHVHVWNKRHLKEAAKAGVLNMLDMLSTNEAHMKSIRDRPGVARVYTAGYAATAPGGHGTQYSSDKPAPTIKNMAEIEPFIKNRIKNNADYIKIIVEPWKNTLSHDLVKEIIKVAHQYNKMAVVHISWGKDARKVIENGADGIVHIWVDTVSEQMLESLNKKHDFFVIPTLLVWITSPHVIKYHHTKKKTEEHHVKEFKKLYDAGITILAGTDPPNNDINYGTDLYKELEYFSRAGMPNIEVLKTATSNPAKEFPFLSGTGYLKVGYNADMILLDKNPVDDIKNIKAINTVWKKGVKIKR